MSVYKGHNQGLKRWFKFPEMLHEATVSFILKNWALELAPLYSGANKSAILPTYSNKSN